MNVEDKEEILNAISNLNDNINEMEARMSSLEAKIELFSRTDFASTLTGCWNELHNAKLKLNNAYEKIIDTCENNTIRFNNMVNEYKGIVCSERADFVKKRNLIRKILEVVK